MILQISTSVNLSAMARTTLLKTLSSNAAKAIQQPESALTVCLHSDAGIMVGGRFGPCAVVNVITSTSVLRPIASELQAAIAASFRSGLPVDPERIKFSFLRSDDHIDPK